MTKSILRVVLTSLALVTMFAGAFNLNRTSAFTVRGDAELGDAEVVIAPAGKCQDLCGCPGGPQLCCTIYLADGTKVNCGMPF
jgi:hypothetical protein